MRVFRSRVVMFWTALLLAFAVIAAACGDDDDSTTAADEPAADEPAADEPAADEPADEPAADEPAADERPFEGVTLQFAKAPHGDDEIENFEEWLAPFEEATGINVEHTVVPWEDLEATYTANFAGGDPFDVTYQVSTHLTLFGDLGAFADVTPLIDGDDFSMERSHFPDSIVDASVYQDQLYGVPFIIGTIVMFANLDLMAEAGITEIPTTGEELIAASNAIQNPPDIWGFSVPTTVNDFGWYFNLQNVHNFGGDIVSEDLTEATINSQPVIDATEYAASLICTEEIQPPLGQYDRNAALDLFRAGKLAFVLDEPLRVAVFQEEGLPFEWDIGQPVGNNGNISQFSTTGHWSISADTDHPEAAWELVKFLSSAEFSKTYNERYAFVPARDDVDVTGGDPLLAKNFDWAMTTWDGLVTHPKIAQVLDEYAKALEAATTCDTDATEALNEAQSRAEELLAG